MNTLRIKLALGLLLAAPIAPAAVPAASVLLVDQAQVEQSSATLKRLQAQAEARQDLRGEQRKQALELVLSEILMVLPDAAAAVAQERKADLVVQASAWPDALEPPEDATAAVIAEIDRRLAKLQLVVP